MENIFCNFYEISSSQDFFCIANILVLMVFFQIAKCKVASSAAAIAKLPENRRKNRSYSLRTLSY